MSQNAKYNASAAAIAAALMLYFGWVAGGMQGAVDHGAAYDLSFKVFNWMLRIGGLAMVVTAIICYTGKVVGLLMEAITSAVCGILMLGCAATWLAFERSLDLNTLLVGVFSLTFLSAARHAWTMYKVDSGSTVRAVAMPVMPAEPVPPHPASQASSALPKEGEPPPEEGYLAALSKEED